MNSEDRRAALAAYKERKAAMGIYAIRCRASGACWLGQSLDLGKIQNRHWFTLRQGNSPHRSLQTAWQHHGAAAFDFEIVEVMEPEEVPYARDRQLKDRLAHWCAALGAAAL